ncbi:MAG: hypothetical protein GDA49_07090 [Rhodospirillales bacterium]|nr:hypothetical protein [Rhodospirillales bacterium]
MLDLVEGWDRDNEHTTWIMRHACRSLIKAGHPKALAMFGFGDTPRVRLENVSVTPDPVSWEGTVAIAFDLVSTARKAQNLMVDYVVHYRTANGSTAPKVFKLKEITLEAGERTSIATKRSLQERTTRRHHPGGHAVEIQINGQACGCADFELLGPT